MDYEKLFDKMGNELAFEGKTDLIEYAHSIMESQKNILDLIKEYDLFSYIYWDGILKGLNATKVESDDKGINIVYYLEDERQDKRDRYINDKLYAINLGTKKMEFMEEMIDKKRPFDDTRNIWNNFFSNTPYDPRADFTKECLNNATPYLDSHFEKLDNYIEKWDMYKEMFDKIEAEEKPIRDMYKQMFDDIEAGKKPMKRSKVAYSGYKKPKGLIGKIKNSFGRKK